MQAIILAAGMGKRLKGLTSENTKCMVEVNGTSLIDRLLKQLDCHGLSRIVLVVGYKGDVLRDYVSSLDVNTPVEFIENPDYATTNNIYSLFIARDTLCEEDTLLFESDLILEDSIIDLLVNSKHPTLAVVDSYKSWMDGTCVSINDDETICEFIPKSSFDYSKVDRYFKTVNVYKFSRAFSRDVYVPFLESYIRACGDNEYYEQVLKVIVDVNRAEIKVERLNGHLWYEIDDIQDLDIASSMFHPGNRRILGS